MMLDTNLIIAFALVALVLVFVRISWTLKEIADALLARGGAETKVKVDFTGMNVEKNEVVEEAEAQSDDTEIAAVIAIASAAMRAAV